MKKLIILSDTHGNVSAMEQVFSIMKESDYIIHLGDCTADILLYKRDLSEKLYSVSGNCDGGGCDLVLDIDGLKILLTHGDRYGVKSGLERLMFKAKEQGVDAVFYGHTHQASIDVCDGIIFINPGSMARFGERSYCYAVITNKKIIAKIVYF